MKFTTQLAALALAPLAAAHFNLAYPPSLGFDEDIEGTTPCGGFPVKFSDNDTKVQVDSFPIALVAGHPAAQILLRGTLNQSAPFTWVDFMPVISETGLNDFCIPDVVAPSSWAGKPGLVQVEYLGPDGPLFQCAAVQYVSGSNTSVSGCSNSTGVSASVIATLSSLTAVPTATGTVAAGAGATSSGIAAQITGAAGLVFGAVVGAAALL